MKIEELHKEWLCLGEKYSKDIQLLKSLWEIILKNYSGKSRYYHNLIHISSMLNLAKENQAKIVDYDAVLFAIWFHDIIYKSSKKDNEEKSADFAKGSLQKLSVDTLKIEKIHQLIISTQKHQIILSEDKDNAFLLDFDLSILGQDWKIYQMYIQKIRREYSLYPDFLYKPGRKKVLEGFLKRKTLYFTEKYQQLLEAKARENIAQEINLLS